VVAVQREAVLREISNRSVSATYSLMLVLLHHSHHCDVSAAPACVLEFI
jgi:hypothetical protein